MSKKMKLSYDEALIELVAIEEKDVIATSSFGSNKENVDQVDKNENSWVPIGGWN